jgi:hypothetical protein
MQRGVRVDVGIGRGYPRLDCAPRFDDGVAHGKDQKMSSVGPDSDHGQAHLDLPSDLARFLADLAHQLRNPAFAISASVEAIESEPGHATTSVFLETIRNEAARLARLASDLQAYIESVQAGRDTAEVETLVAAALDQVRPMAAARDVGLGSAAGWVGPRWRCDATALVRALVALLEHAVLRSRPGSTVQLSFELVRAADRGREAVACADDRRFRRGVQGGRLADDPSAVCGARCRRQRSRARDRRAGRRSACGSRRGHERGDGGRQYRSPRAAPQRGGVLR